MASFSRIRKKKKYILDNEVTTLEDGDESNSSNASKESEDNTDGNLDGAKAGIKKSGRIES